MNLYLPRAAAHEVRASPGAAKEAARATGETVLVVEDNPELRRLSLRRLELLGYRVFQAESGPAALVLLDAGERIDLIFSDVVMPGGMTGYELAIHARERFPLLKVLLTSGYDAVLASEQDMTGSDLRVLRKPYKQAELARALREALAS